MVIMSSSRAFCFFPSVKKQKHYFQVCFASLTEQDIEKLVEGKDSQTQKGRRRWQRSMFADYVKEKKPREPEEMKEFAQTLKTFYFEARKKGFVQCIIKQLLDSVFVISRLNNQGLGKGYRLRLIIHTSTLINLDITKTSSNNCLLLNSIPSRRFQTTTLLLRTK